MCFELVNLVYELDFGTDGCKKSVLLSLADQANKDEDDTCYPSNRYTAFRCSITSRTVQKKVAELEKDDFITVYYQYKGDGTKQTSNLYKVNRLFLEQVIRDQKASKASKYRTIKRDPERRSISSKNEAGLMLNHLTNGTETVDLSQESMDERIMGGMTQEHGRGDLNSGDRVKLVHPLDESGSPKPLCNRNGNQKINHKNNPNQSVQGVGAEIIDNGNYHKGYQVPFSSNYSLLEPLVTKRDKPLGGSAFTNGQPTDASNLMEKELHISTASAIEENKNLPLDESVVYIRQNSKEDVSEIACTQEAVIKRENVLSVEQSTVSDNSKSEICGSLLSESVIDNDLEHDGNSKLPDPQAVHVALRDCFDAMRIQPLHKNKRHDSQASTRNSIFGL